LRTPAKTYRLAPQAGSLRYRIKVEEASQELRTAAGWKKIPPVGEASSFARVANSCKDVSPAAASWKLALQDKGGKSSRYRIKVAEAAQESRYPAGWKKSLL
jgi:hypothetical protein